ncbi:hypothetical protein JHK82_027285 [Glycine max]|nr:hypothetical protein JHK82_027285 [Glycine max]
MFLLGSFNPPQPFHTLVQEIIGKAPQRSNPERRRDKVYIGCGAGFGGDKPLAALKLLQRVQELNYLVLECLAERTLADRYQIMMSGGDGYDSQSRISSRLLLKLVGGKSLSRRERQQLTRTTADIFSLVPFVVFIIIPFMELLLPVFLKLFPNMLPSTFQDKMKEQEALKRRLNARIEYAKFLQDTIKEMAKEIQNSQSGEMKKTAKDLDEFMNKVRTGARVSNDEILGFAKLFNDELTLDNISRLVLLPLLMFNKLCSPVINLIFWGSATVLICLFGYENGKQASLGKYV